MRNRNGQGPTPAGHVPGQDGPTPAGWPQNPAAFPLPGNARYGMGALPGRGQQPPRIVGTPPPAPCGPEQRIGAPNIPCTPAEAAEAKEKRDQNDALIQASLELIWYNQPSPIVEPPFRSDVLDETFARVVINVPTAPGDADGAQGATEVANAESAISGVAIPILTPATVGDPVTVFTFRVPLGHAMYLHSVGAWGHDFLASREVIAWQVIAAGKAITTVRELGLLGSPDTPVRVHAILREDAVLTIRAFNRDTVSASLVEFIAFGWVFPVLRNDDTFRGLLDPQRGPKDQGRYAPGQIPGAC